jgi:hypothetical protein
MAEDTDFGALYRELGIDSTCSLTELRGAWRRRVSQLHPDLGGSAEDTGQLQQLNRLYDAALDFHARYRRMPGAMSSGHLSPKRPEPASSAPVSTGNSTGNSAGDPHGNELPESGFGRISRYFVTVSLVAIAVLGWRVVENKPGNGNVRAADVDQADVDQADVDRADVDRADPDRIAMVDASSDSGTLTVRTLAKPMTATRAIAAGMGKITVREILGEPLDMQSSRWNYGPSWVEFRCDKVADWYSSPLRPLHVSAARDATAGASMRGERDCD